MGDETATVDVSGSIIKLLGLVKIGKRRVRRGCAFDLAGISRVAQVLGSEQQSDDEQYHQQMSDTKTHTADSSL